MNDLHELHELHEEKQLSRGLVPITPTHLKEWQLHLEDICGSRRCTKLGVDSYTGITWGFWDFRAPVLGAST